MTADILLFTPRSNQKADRAFWKGNEKPVWAGNENIAADTSHLTDTAPSEMNMDEPA